MVDGVEDGAEAAVEVGAEMAEVVVPLPFPGEEPVPSDTVTKSGC